MENKPLHSRGNSGGNTLQRLLAGVFGLRHAPSHQQTARPPGHPWPHRPHGSVGLRDHTTTGGNLTQVARKPLPCACAACNKASTTIRTLSGMC